MTWETHPLEGGLGEWGGAWDDINQRLYRANPFYDSRFVEPLLAHFGGNGERLCVHRRDGRIDGLLILAPRYPGTWTAFLPAQAQVAPMLLEQPEDLAGLFAALPGLVWCLELLNQDPNYCTLFQLAESALVKWQDHDTTINVNLAGTFEDYWGNRSKNLRKNIKRHINRVEKDGNTITTIRHTIRDSLEKAVARYGELESAGWKGEAGTAIRSDNIQGAFYSDMLTRFARQEDASIYELYFSQRLVSSRLCITSDNILIILKTTYDESMAAYAPGRVLLHSLLKEEFSSKRFEAVEFYTDATQDQIQWCTGQRRIRHLTLYRNVQARRATEVLKRIKDRMRSLPPIRTPRLRP